MAIYYHSDFSKIHGEFNFGDDINPYLLKHFLSKDLYNSTSDCVVGIGTLLNNTLLTKVQNYKKIHVFSSGVGYGAYDHLMQASNINYISVRGPKSAIALELPKEKAITDGAILLSELKHPPKKKHKITFIPHVNTHWTSGKLLYKACEKLGYNYLVPNIEPFEFMDAVNNSDLVITEAMHGAILADTYRVPWIPVSMHNALGFKWEDWCQSLEMKYQPTNLVKAYDPQDNLTSKLKSKLKYELLLWNLLKVVKKEPYLSNDTIFDEKLGIMLDLIGEL